MSGIVGVTNVFERGVRRRAIRILPKFRRNGGGSFGEKRTYLLQSERVNILSQLGTFILCELIFFTLPFCRHC